MAKTEGQKQSQKHEKRLAAAVGGKVVGASGAGWSHKADIRADDVLVEHKYTAKNSYSVSQTTWRKIETEAVKISRTPVLGLCINGLNLVVLDENDYLAMREELEHLKEQSDTDS
jgi:hypothetical protein